MKELVAAVADSEKGRTASLSALVSEYERRMSSRPSKEEHDRLRTEVRRSCWHPYTRTYMCLKVVQHAPLCSTRPAWAYKRTSTHGDMFFRRPCTVRREVNAMIPDVGAANAGREQETAG